jgi:hypothetical protein
MLSPLEKQQVTRVNEILDLKQRIGFNNANLPSGGSSQQQADRVNEIHALKQHLGFNNMNLPSGGININPVKREKAIKKTYQRDQRNQRSNPFSEAFLLTAKDDLIKQKKKLEGISQEEINRQHEEALKQSKFGKHKLQSEEHIAKVIQQQQLADQQLAQLKHQHDQYLEDKEYEDHQKQVVKQRQAEVKSSDSNVQRLQDKYVANEDLLKELRQDINNNERMKAMAFDAAYDAIDEQTQRQYEQDIDGYDQNIADLSHQIKRIQSEEPAIMKAIDEQMEVLGVALQYLDQAQQALRESKPKDELKKAYERYNTILNDKSLHQKDIDVNKKIVKKYSKSLASKPMLKHTKLAQLDKEIKALEARKKKIVKPKHKKPVKPIRKAYKPLKKGGVTAGKTSNPWIKHVKSVRKEHPKLSYKEVLVLASKSYKPKGGMPAGKLVKHKAIKHHKKGGVLAGKQVNPWIKHVMQYRVKHPQLSYREAMQQARSSYHK